MARPTKLTPEIAAAICDVVRAGNYMETAAAYAGVRKNTFYDWLKRGRGDLLEGRDETVHAQLVDGVEQALAQSEVRDLALIGEAAKEVWQAAAWRLERRMPDKYGRRTRVDHGTHDGRPFPVGLTFDPSKLNDEELDAMRALLEKAQPQEG